MNGEESGTPKAFNEIAQGRGTPRTLGYKKIKSDTPKALHRIEWNLVSWMITGWTVTALPFEYPGASRMPQSLAQIYLHIVFSTKERHPSLADEAIRTAMHKYLGGTCNGLKCPVIRVGGATDHVHVLCHLGREISVSDLVRDLKRESSKSIKVQYPTATEFHWQNGYGAFSVSPSHLDDLISYIDHQMEHHRTESFQDEFRRILRKYGLEWDERYVWD
jgi:putative transposase